MTTTLQRLRELEQAATPSPWEVVDQIFFAGNDGLGEMDGERDANLVAAARNHLPQLLNIAEAAMTLNENADDFSQDGSARVGGRDLAQLVNALAALDTTEPT